MDQDKLLDFLKTVILVNLSGGANTICNILKQFTTEMAMGQILALETEGLVYLHDLTIDPDNDNGELCFALTEEGQRAARSLCLVKSKGGK